MLKTKNKNNSSRLLKFPENFLWGTATSAHQIEGNNTNSDWWHFEQSGDMRHQSEKAAGSYQLFKQDHQLIQQISNNAYRLSLEWSRLEPRENEWDEEAIKHYLEVLSDLKRKNIKIMLTLHHFTNPYWFTAKGGWANLGSVFYFKRYVKQVIKHFGGLVDFWITINEPAIYVDLGYVRGQWPPKQKSVGKAFLAYINMARAHRAAYKLLHKKLSDPKVGVAMNVHSFASYHKHRLIELLYVHFADRFVNHSFYDLTKNKHDFLGINYYFRVRLVQQEGSLKPAVQEIKEEERELSDVGWMIYPHGIFDVLMDLEDFKLPIYITENGVAAADDNKRIRFLIDHLKEIHHAIKAGVDVRGYFHWSLLDNFEWEKGFDPKFGLIDVDFDTLQRKLKPSARLYAEIASHNALDEEICQNFLNNHSSTISEQATNNK